MSKETRVRQRGGYSPRTALYRLYHTNGTVQDTIASRPMGQLESMTDVVTKPFTAGRIWVNSPMERSSVMKDHSPAVGTTALAQPAGSEGFNRADGGQFRDCDSRFDTLLGELSNYDVQSLVTQAATQAIAGIKRPEMYGLVSLREARSTLQSLRNPLQGALAFLERNTRGKPRGMKPPLSASAKRRANKGKLRQVQASAKAVADQHLTIVFGIMPFVSDIQAILKTLKAEEPVSKTYVSRGSASAMDSKTLHDVVTTYSDGTNTEKTTYDIQVTRTVNVRAYQYYVAKLTLAEMLGVSLDEIPRALWQTTTLSFVVDWFVNVGDYIASMTPKLDVDLGISGYTITTVDACDGSYSIATTHTGAYGWAGNYAGGSQQRVAVTKARKPVTLHDQRGLAFKRNYSRDLLGTGQITSLCSLIVQRIKNI